MMKNVTFIAVGVMFLSGCVTPAVSSYQKPKESRVDNSLVVEKGFDATWDDLIGYASQTFFAIENFEKDSGLLTLSFGSGDVSRFVDCGQFNRDKDPQFNGPYASYIQMHQRATLSGKMNLRVREVNNSSTEVIVNARYILNVPPSTQQIYNVWTSSYNFVNIPSMTWSFDSTSSDSRTVVNSAIPENAVRVCQPTGLAESEILEGVVKQN